MSRYLLKEIQELADQQIRFTPRGKKIEQSLKAEQLYREITDSQFYSYRFVCRFITDFRSEIHQKLQFSGKILKHDLLLFAEELYNSCNVNADEVSGKVWTLKEISKKYNVSEKTVSRWRKNGLFARRLLFGQKKTLVFLEHSIEEFFRNNQTKIYRGGQFNRLNIKEKNLILQAAHRFSAKADTPAEIISTIARYLGRSPETVRLTLLRYNKKNLSSAVFQQRKTLNETDRKDIFERYQQGISVHSLSAEYRRSRSNIHWIIAKQRAKQIFALPLSYIIADNKSGRYKSPDNALDNFPDKILFEEIKKTSQAKTKTAVLLSAEQESLLFRQMNEYKYRASLLRDSLNSSRPQQSVMSQIEEYYGKAVAVKKKIVEFFFPLVISAAKQHLSISNNMNGGLDMLISNGCLTLIQAAETFDYRRGNRFSTYLTWAVAKAFVRFNLRMKSSSEIISDVPIENLPDYRKNIHTQTDEQIETEQIISQLLGILDGSEQMVIRYRFGIETEQPLTLNETGKELDVSGERVRQMEKTALTKLKSKLKKQN